MAGYYVYTLGYPESMGGCVFYVGKGTGSRIYDHERQARGASKEVNHHKCRIIRKIWASGGQVVKTKLAHFEEERDALDFEIALIFLMGGLCNLTMGGEGTLDIAEETRLKISKALRGRAKSEEHRRKLSEINKGKSHTEETRRKMSEAQMNRAPVTEETRRKIGNFHAGIKKPYLSEANKTRVLSEESRRKMREAAKQRTFSEETRLKMSIARKGQKRKPHSEETRRKIGEKSRGRSLQRNEKGQYAKQLEM